MQSKPNRKAQASVLKSSSASASSGLVPFTFFFTKRSQARFSRSEVYGQDSL